jgi:trk system potassium uptake protein TrkH
MNLRAVFHLISYLLFFVTIGMFGSWGVSLLYDETKLVSNGMLQAAMLSSLISGLMWLLTRGPIDLSRRDGFGIVTFGWLAVAHLGALPYLMTGSIADPVSAIFETMSGFTATGSTILRDIEALPHGILFWRALTQWYGGMGIIVLAVAILPFLGVGGMQLFSAEMTGPAKDRLTPRIESTAKLLWAVYLLLTAVAIVALKLVGMDWFDAVCHGFTSAATGGFSTRNSSIAAFNSVAIENVIIFIMLLGAMSFPLHYRALTGRPLAYWRDSQFRVFMGIWITAVLLISLNLGLQMDRSIGQSLRQAAFQVSTMISSTGYVSSDYDQWPALSRFVLLLVMVIGGCAGSTAGGMKVIRFYALIKKGLREIRLFMRPDAVVQVKIGKKTVSQDIISKITSYFVIYMFVWAFATLAMAAFTPDLETAFSAVLSAISNMGPGFGAVGAVQNYADIPSAGKMLLTFLMLLGRLELYTVLVLFLPSFWKR